MHRAPIHAALPLALAVAVLGTVGLTGTATADVVESEWTNQDTFRYRIRHMPDFDQRRREIGEMPGLPNNGSMYCVPTSTMNALAYIASHGFPTVAPGRANWQSQETYRVATDSLFLFGELMSTHPSNGTTFNGWIDGVEALLPLDTFTYSAHIVIDGYTPRFADMAGAAGTGSLIVLGHGAYDEDGEQEGVPRIVRDGGHNVTLTRAYGDTDLNELYVRDPADSPSDAMQSTFTERVYEVVDRSVFAFGRVRTMSNLQRVPGRWSSRYLDGYLAIRPKAGYSFTEDGLNYFNGVSVWGGLNPREIRMPIPPGELLTDLIIGPDQSRIYYTSRRGEQHRLFCTSILTGRTEPIDIAPVTIQPHIVFGRFRQLYRLSGRQLAMIPDDETPEIVNLVLPETCEAIAYNDRSDRVAVLDVDGRRLYEYRRSLTGRATVTLLPAAGELPLGANPKMTWDPHRDGYWFVSDASDDVFLLIGSTVTRVSHEALRRPTSVDADDAGHMFAVAEGQLHEFREDDGAWTRVDDSVFADMPVGAVARITKCRTNYDPNVHDGPEWVHLLPTEGFGNEVIDCLADLDLDGSVGFSDLLVVLSAWGPCPPEDYCDVDLDFSGAVGFGDLLIVLSAWGPCP